ncbi:WD repeat-containing protein 87-like [Hydractinia symbiolongicarpus]|uniref:WD repeat-containing protein 87-like n=1 Tax=Hydractinia symbiolongicarpus TaxID=13093 RepID=UPI00254CA368|nr:WD repeat-containing protein 87-like [Hydractinia symbiolongicarpus]
MMPTAPNRGLIRKIEPSPPSTQNLFNFLTMCTENIITFWRIVRHHDNYISLAMVDTINLGQKPDQIAIVYDILAVAYKKRIKYFKVAARKQQQGFFISVITHIKDESHTANITQLCGNDNLRIIASASKDSRIKIWDVNCSLLRELVFDNTLSEVGFANNRGDLLVGFQNNLYYVPATEYLPRHYLERLLDNTIAEDSVEFCIPFDPLLKFWYDSQRVETISVLNTNSVKWSSKRIDLPRKLTLDNENSIDSSLCSMTHSVRSSSQEKYDLSKFGRSRSISRLKKLYEKRKVAKLFLASQNQKKIEEKLPPMQMKEEENIQKITWAEDLEISLKEMAGKKYWPCAPDGFIPNSVIRNTVAPEPAPNVVEPWKPRKFVKEEKGFEYVLEDYFEDCQRKWESDEEEDSLNYEDLPDFNFDDMKIKKTKEAEESLHKRKNAAEKYSFFLRSIQKNL